MSTDDTRACQLSACYARIGTMGTCKIHLGCTLVILLSHLAMHMFVLVKRVKLSYG